MIILTLLPRNATRDILYVIISKFVHDAQRTAIYACSMYMYVACVQLYLLVLHNIYVIGKEID